MTTKIITRFLLTVILLWGLSACSKGKDQRIPQSVDDIKGLRVAFSSGSTYDVMYSMRTDISTHPFNTPTDCLAALVNGQVDIYVEDDYNLPPEDQARLGIKMAFRGTEEFQCAFALRKDADGLRDSLSAFIDSLKSTGELQEIYERWFNCDTPSRLRIPDLGPMPTGKPIIVGEACLLAPVAFLVKKEWHGFEPEIMYRFARYVGRPVEVVNSPFISVIASVQSGATDIIGGGIFITEERQKSISFSSSHFSGHPGWFVKDNKSNSDVSFFARIAQSFRNNLIVEDRWRYIAAGLWETIIISIFAILLGSILGAIVCAMRMSRRRWISLTAKTYIDLMRGIPMLVLLLIMFYVVLSPIGVSARLVAILSFSMNFSAYVSEMFRTSIMSISRGQTEAGLAIGFTPVQTFLHIIAPQALRHVMPVFKGESVSLFKNTSIVGYIAILDLTRASDMIRTRTFDAFFPLLVVALFYLVLAWLLGKFLDFIVNYTTKK